MLGKASKPRTVRLLPPAIALTLFAAIASYAIPRGFHAQALMAIDDDPLAIAEHRLDDGFNAAVADREITSALAAKDIDLARSFVDLAAARHLTIDPALAAQVNTASAEAASAPGRATSFARGLITGVPTDDAALAGTVLGDLFVFGDVRDLTREGIHAARHEPVDELVVGLAAAGIAITAGTYATLGVAAPLRAGLTLVKAAARTGRMSIDLAQVLGRMLRRRGRRVGLGHRGARCA